MEEYQNKTIDSVKRTFLNGINIATSGLYVVLIFFNPSDSKQSKDIAFFTFISLVMMAILMIGLTIYDIKGSVTKSVAPSQRRMWKTLRRIHHIGLITLFLLLFFSGYHSFFGYFVCVITIPVQFFCTEAWGNLVVCDEPVRMHPLVERIEMEMSQRPLVEIMHDSQ